MALLWLDSQDTMQNAPFTCSEARNFRNVFFIKIDDFFFLSLFQYSARFSSITSLFNIAKNRSNVVIYIYEWCSWEDGFAKHPTILYGQNRSVEELVLGLNFGSAAAKLPQPMAIDESVPRLGEDERAFSLTPHFVLCLDH
jgi:hypothetical protein